MNAHMYETMSESEIWDFQLKGKKRWFRLFSDPEIFRESFDLENKSQWPASWWDKDNASVKKSLRNPNWGLGAGNANDKVAELTICKEKVESAPPGANTETKPATDYKEKVMMLFRKVAQRAPKAIWFDDDCNTDDECIRLDKAKLRCELLKTLKEKLCPNSDSDE